MKCLNLIRSFSCDLFSGQQTGLALIANAGYLDRIFEMPEVIRIPDRL